MIAEWQKLLKQVEVRGDIFELTSDEDLLEFEARTGIVLPSNYKEFCQVFGSGEFGNDLLNIHVISHDNLLSMVEWTSQLKDNLDMEVYLDDLTMAKLEVIRHHLKSALIFGGNGKSQFCFWDLTTYKKLDDSCDIYLASWGSYDCCRVGRDFFTFVKDFCLGMKPYDYLPESLHPDDTSIFFRISDSNKITPWIKILFEGGMSAESISNGCKVPLEIVRQAIERATDIGDNIK